MIWAIAAILTGFVFAALAHPFFGARPGRPAVTEKDYFAAQLDDIERERAAGLLSEDEAAQAALEARRRLLDAARRGAGPEASPRAAKAAKWASLALIAAAPGAALLVYGALGNPAMTRPGSFAPAAASMSQEEQAAMIEGKVQSLAARLEENPDDVEGWMRLGRSYGVLGRMDESIAAYEQAAALAPEDLDARRAYAMALLSRLAVQSRPMDSETETALLAVISLNPEDVFALYFLGIAAAQTGDADKARAYWEKLLAQMPEGSDEAAQLRNMIEGLVPSP
jgi:cytochrome c-type biogenesis protein CcmH